MRKGHERGERGKIEWPPEAGEVLDGKPGEEDLGFSNHAKIEN